MVRWNTYKKNALQAAFEVSDVQGKAIKEQEIQRNKEILTRLIDITLYLARQGKAFRGDDESASSSNQGNFLELVKMFNQYDSVLRLHLDNVNDQKMEALHPGECVIQLQKLSDTRWACREKALKALLK
ncbi:hypothetical protein KUCAC02_015445 [Chaenocephalus aceratus]|uniref:Uncharacterized protein n=1 Tax=Chaenocephalus aceratus TaxID=36190 RepID=A0ACB9XYS9_CHAAC|nr:hypothetical protein KUCAC02_015445 [Chaenocephalus aceratus]